ncbi:hypothetical protein FRB99_004956 [Tulasnella sp. 403]|nr:hypothetical protein FRB99_004956 [Tulasnella sp. 403]
MLRSLKVFVIQSKLESDEVARLYALAEGHGAESAPIDDAQVVITSIRSPVRLQRHLDLHIAAETRKAIVIPQWLSDTVERGELLPFEAYHALKQSSVGDRSPSMVSQSSGTELRSNRTPSVHTTLTPVSTDMPSTSSPAKTIGSSLGETSTSPTRETTENTRFATHRLSPLVCPNQDLLSEVGVIMKSRRLDGNMRSALSYSRAISVRQLTSDLSDAITFLSETHIFDQRSSKIDEFVKTGGISEARSIDSTPRFHALGTFSSIYSIGPTKARHLYDDLGCQSLEDLEAYAEQLPDDEPATHALRSGLQYREDFEKPIPRDEVERIAVEVTKHLNAIVPGCLYTICGGYRRGKSVSNDVDIVFTHPSPEFFKGLCARLVERLTESGLVSHLFHMSSFSSVHEAPRSRRFGGGRPTHFDSLDKALTAFRLPSGYTSHETVSSDAQSIREPMDTSEDDVAASSGRVEGAKTVPIATFDTSTPYRRVDLVFAPPRAYWTAVVGWTGSTQFERDLRLWANQVGLHFDSTGILRDTTPIFAHNERHVFEILQLEYVEPEMRNADI